MCIVSISSVPDSVTNRNICQSNSDALVFACLSVYDLSYLAY